MKKLFMVVLAVVLSLGVASLGYAQAPAGDKKMEEKKADGKMEKKPDGKMDKMEKKADGKMEKKAEGKDGKMEKKVEKKAEGKDGKMEKKVEKKDKKDAANPCAAKAAEKK